MVIQLQGVCCGTTVFCTLFVEYTCQSPRTLRSLWYGLHPHHITVLTRHQQVCRVHAQNPHRPPLHPICYQTGDRYSWVSIPASACAVCMQCARNAHTVQELGLSPPPLQPAIPHPLTHISLPSPSLAVPLHPVLGRTTAPGAKAPPGMCTLARASLCVCVPKARLPKGNGRDAAPKGTGRRGGGAGP